MHKLLNKHKTWDWLSNKSAIKLISWNTSLLFVDTSNLVGLQRVCNKTRKMIFSPWLREWILDLIWAMESNFLNLLKTLTRITRCPFLWGIFLPQPHVVLIEFIRKSNTPNTGYSLCFWVAEHGSAEHIHKRTQPNTAEHSRTQPNTEHAEHKTPNMPNTMFRVMKVWTALPHLDWQTARNMGKLL